MAETDRELLEKAARAAGYRIAAPVEKHVAQPGRFAGGFIIDNDKGGQSCWNPLTDHGDRYRLARDRRLTVDFEGNFVSWGDPKLRPLLFIHFNPGDDNSEAYAILRAAAMGEA